MFGSSHKNKFGCGHRSINLHKSNEQNRVTKYSQCSDIMDRKWGNANTVDSSHELDFVFWFYGTCNLTDQ